LITLAYLVYWTGVSIDKACGILAFFTGLELSKSQADSLLSQLATDWQVEYDAVRTSRDRRLSIGRQARVKRLQTRIRLICHRYGEILGNTPEVDDTKFVRLQNELVDHIEKLFLFVLHPEVEPTNNRSICPF
jgi:hypothetical protein